MSIASSAGLTAFDTAQLTLPELIPKPRLNLLPVRDESSLQTLKLIKVPEKCKYTCHMCHMVCMFYRTGYDVILLQVEVWCEGVPIVWKRY